MINLSTFCKAAALLVLTTGLGAQAQDLCATEAQARQIAAFYADQPGTLPVMAARRLQLPESVVASGLGEAWSASAPGSAFGEVWSALAGIEQANFLIMKGQNVFEILSGVSAGAPSTRSDFFNIKYENPVRGHLRPDLYSAIYAVAIPGKDDAVARGVLFYDLEGALVFGVFVSGESLEPSPDVIEQFDAAMALVRTKPSVCAAP